MPHPSSAPGARMRPRLAVALSCVAVLAALLPTAASAGALNTAVLDNGTCGHNLQLGSDPTASSSATPWFLLYGDGGAASYQIFIDAVSIGTFTTSDPYGDVCINDTMTLAQGAHVLTGNELAPHSTSTLTPFNFSVDTVPPAVPSAPVLSANTDSGAKGDNLTNYKSPTLTGTSEPGVAIRIFDGFAGVGGARADTSGHWLVATVALADGTHTLTATTADQAGNMSAHSASLSLTIDATPPPAPPAPTLDPGSDTPPLGDNTTTVTSPVVDGAGAPASSTITVMADGSAAGATAANGLGNWQFTMPALAVGSHTISAKSTDAAGNTGPLSSALIVTIGTSSLTVPGAPSLTGATAGTASVALVWTAPASNGGSPITGYKVYRGASAGGETLFTTLGVVTSYTNTGLTNGTTYYYKISALNTVGESVLSNELSATPATSATVPGAPTLTSATAGNASVALVWTPPASNGGSPITGYTATASPGGASCSSAGLGCTVSGLSNGTTYSFSVTASNIVGTGSASNTLSATPAAVAAVPGAPQNVAASQNKPRGIALTWAAPASNGGATITGYKIYRSTSAGAETLYATVSNVTKYKDTSASSGVVYYYKIAAINSIGTGPNSTEVSCAAR
jgi:fibronectin type 3 domain-containing protein